MDAASPDSTTVPAEQTDCDSRSAGKLGGNRFEGLAAFGTVLDWLAGTRLDWLVLAAASPSAARRSPPRGVAVAGRGRQP